MQFIATSRQFGDTLPYHVFHVGPAASGQPGTRHVCPACFWYDQGENPNTRALIFSPQVALDVLLPDGR